MRFRLTPHERGFYPLFVRAAENIASAASTLAQLVAAEPAARGDRARQIKDCELAGDELTHDILVLLNRTFITPFDREDIHRLASALDDVLDAIEEAADRIVLYRLGALPAQMLAQAAVLCRAAEATVEAMPRLEKVTELLEYTIVVNSLEEEADAVYRSLLGGLLAPDDGRPHDLLDVLKTKEVVEILEEAADAFEAVANTVQSIAVKEG